MTDIREQIARVIDPEAFGQGSDSPHLTLYFVPKQKLALKKADAILSLLPSPEAGELVERTKIVAWNVAAEAVKMGGGVPHEYLIANIARYIEGELSALLRTPISGQDGWQLVPKVAIDWLEGSGPDHEGKWFGEVKDAADSLGVRYKPAYWWRSHFRKICEVLSSAPKSPSNERERDSITKALIVARNEMAALLVDPLAVTPSWPVENPADAECLTTAYNNIRAVLCDLESANPNNNPSPTTGEPK